MQRVSTSFCIRRAKTECSINLVNQTVINDRREQARRFEAPASTDVVFTAPVISRKSIMRGDTNTMILYPLRLSDMSSARA